MDYAAALVQIRILTTELQDKLNSKKIDESTAILDSIGVQMNLIYEWLYNQ